MNDHDDGLMHNPGRATDAFSSIQVATPKRVSMIVASASECDHDDGLVHDHNWACTERGAPAHK